MNGISMNLFERIFRLTHLRNKREWKSATAVFTGKCERAIVRTKMGPRLANYNAYEIVYEANGVSQCPFNAKYVPVLEQTAKENDIPFRAIHIESRDEAQKAPTPITNYALFYDGEYVTNEQMNDKKFLKLIGR